MPVPRLGTVDSFTPPFAALLRMLQLPLRLALTLQRGLCRFLGPVRRRLRCRCMCGVLRARLLSSCLSGGRPLQDFPNPLLHVIPHLGGALAAARR